MKRKHVPLIQKSLSVVLASLLGQEVVVELKNDEEIKGILESVEHGMDLKLLNATLNRHVNDSKPLFTSSRSGLLTEVSSSSQLNVDLETQSILIRGDQIRLVHLPARLNIASHLTTQMKSLEHKNFSKKQKIGDKISSNLQSSASSSNCINSFKKNPFQVKEEIILNQNPLKIDSNV
jgi:small nuclear ribonucleoprotein (snRNP)-like protein